MAAAAATASVGLSASVGAERSEDTFAVETKSRRVRGTFGSRCIAVIKPNRAPTSEEEQDALFAKVQTILDSHKNASEKEPDLVVLYDFSKAALSTHMSMPTDWIARNKKQLKAKVIRSAVLLANSGQKLIIKWFAPKDPTLPPYKPFRNDNVVTIHGKVYSLGLWEAYDWLLKGKKKALKFNASFLTQILEAEAHGKKTNIFRPLFGE